MICGVESWNEIEDYGNAKIDWLKMRPIRADSGLTITAQGNGTLLITAPRSCSVTVSGIDGRTRRVTLRAGHNSLTLPQGFYIIDGQKVKL